jgi:hypothetical protein
MKHNNTHHAALIRDCKPNFHVEGKAISAIWSHSVSKLTNDGFEQDCGYNDAGVRFTASYDLVGRRFRVTLTPHAPGAITNLRRWFWFNAEHKLKAVDDGGIKVVS